MYSNGAGWSVITTRSPIYTSTQYIILYTNSEPKKQRYTLYYGLVGHSKL